MLSKIFIFASLAFHIGCSDNVQSLASPCKTMTPGVQFEARVHDRWCLADGSLEVTIGPILEDSRCPVDVVCIWGGRIALEVWITGSGHPQRRDTLLHGHDMHAIQIGNSTLTLEEVKPLRYAGVPIDTMAYRFRMIYQ
jgi:hypothetical protein